jgi:hypothetical protein
VPIGALRHPDLDAEIHPPSRLPTGFEVRQSRAGHTLDAGRDRLEYA